ncbi:acyl-CoA/acyl-ACP dehydrogenase [Rhodococcus pseudokoreensis]|uniref:Acyl-CoA/acyl-ACP dehydrogenase n=1 Tax=Rhodococcus pseudokoreensis TaxID=2811421 RepID=A0A974W7C9_9NOCA|nr:acyl-CoA dehydrogenase family protein [Rhodococcus pseudokoreensis]QSE92565.1 acyl-CoA/acyl-ACP dehydrogenase [Rhodococcus pseudokoreensis]
MASVFGEEQNELRRVVRRFFEEKSSEDEVRRLMETDDGYDRRVWAQMAGQLGLQGLAIPEQYGGSGFTQLEMSIVLEEMGRALVCAPVLSSAVLAANLLLESGDEEAKTRLLPVIADGSVIATVALAESSGRWDGDGIAITAERDATGWAVTGEKLFVLDGGTADVVLVVARTDLGLSLFEVSAGSAGLTVRPMDTMDRTRKQSTMVFSRTPARLIGAEGGAAIGVERMLDLAAVAVAAEDVGGALRQVELAAEYARTRSQFGKVIGSYQAIKQKLADMLLSVELSKAAAYRVAQVAVDDPATLAVEAGMAKALCAETYVQVAYDTIQIHGGIGFTWEHPAHLYFRRAKSNASLFGTPAHHRELVAQRMGL